MHIVIFEGARWTTFAPLSLSRPVFMLASGASTLVEKQIRHLKPSRLSLWVRPEMEQIVRTRIVPKLPVPATVNQPLDDEPACIISGRTLHLKEFKHASEYSVVADENQIIQRAYVKSPGLAPADVLARSDRWTALLDLPRDDAEVRTVDFLWDLVKWNEESLMADFAQMNAPTQPLPTGPFHVIDPHNVWLGTDVTVQPGVVLDASKGPVMIDQRANIGANAVIQGPVYIGPYVQIAPLANIRGGTSLGMMCKVGGEVSNSIMFGYSNKAHDGFLGDSYVGKWCNMGAGTTTSNLKNTYGEISVRAGGADVKTGRRFLGTLFGDHARTAIQTRLMAGTYLGFSSMVASSSIVPKVVSSFSFLTDRGPEPYRIDKAIEVMKTVYARRHRVWDDNDEWVVRYVSETAPGVEQ